jgi:hypothetical protein
VKKASFVEACTAKYCLVLCGANNNLKCYELPQYKPLAHKTLIDFQDSLISLTKLEVKEVQQTGDVIEDFESISEVSSFSRAVSDNCLPQFESGN